MLYCAICFGDRDQAHAYRAQKSKHLSYWRRHHALQLAGPFYDEDHQTKIGCLIVIRAANRQAAEEIFHHDPLYQSGVFSSCEIHPWGVVTEMLHDPADEGACPPQT